MAAAKKSVLDDAIDHMSKNMSDGYKEEQEAKKHPPKHNHAKREHILDVDPTKD